MNPDNDAALPGSDVSRAHPAPPADLLTTPDAWDEAGLDGSLQDSLRELLRRQNELRESEAQHRDFVENASVGLHRVGADGTILWANRAELELLGYGAEEYVGQPITAFHVDLHVIEDMLARLARGETLDGFEARLRAKDGSLKHVLISSSAYMRDGELVHTRCFTRDITARREAEEALRRSREQLQLITDALPFLVAYVDAEQKYAFVNAAYEEWLGRPRDELCGRRLEAALGAEAFATIRPRVEQALAGHSVKYETELLYPDGRRRSIEATYIPQFSERGEVLGFVSLVADITERAGFERYRATAATRNERLLSITTAIANAVGTTEVFEAVLDQVAATMNASSAGLWLAQDEGRTARLERSLGYEDSVRDALAVLPLEGAPPMPILDCMRLGRPVWLPSQEALFASYPHLRGTATEGRSYRIACLPLLAQGHMLGALGLTIEGRDEQTEDEKSFLVIVARYASQALQRSRI
jgi:PAS domain S-box-containing protein